MVLINEDLLGKKGFLRVQRQPLMADGVLNVSFDDGTTLMRKILSGPSALVDSAEEQGLTSRETKCFPNCLKTRASTMPQFVRDV